MAIADYRLCDVCGSKVFYNANLNYTLRGGEWVPDGWLGDWAVICQRCERTHEVVILPRDRDPFYWGA